MKALKMVVLNILYFVGIIILAVVIALVTLFCYFTLQLIIFGRGDYLLFVSSGLNMIPAIMIMILIIYALIRVQEKFSKRKENQIGIVEEDDDEPVDIETLSKLEKLLIKLLYKLVAIDETITKIFKAIKICYIPVLIIALYRGMTSYAILYTDSVKVSSPIVPTGIIY